MRAPWSTDGLLRALHRLGSTRHEGSLATRPLRSACWAGFLSLVVWTNPAARGARPRAVARLWAWQLWRRVVRRPVEVVSPGGSRLRLPTWSVLAGVTVATGHHEPSEQLFVAAYLRPGEGVVDVGANIGLYTVPCAALGARVVALEPSSRARQALEANVRLNRIEDRVRVLPCAAGAADGAAQLTTGLDAGNHLVGADVGSDEPGEYVEVRTLDSLLPEIEGHLGAARLALLKVDVEGHDAEVLHGAGRLLREYRPVVIVEAWHGGRELRALLAGQGYDVHRYDPADGSLVAYRADWDGHCNFIAVPEPHLAEARRRLAEQPAAVLRLPRVRWRPAGDGTLSAAGAAGL